MRFQYSQFTTRDKARQAIEHYFATGEIDESDYPEIKRCKSHSGQVYYAVTLLYFK